MFGWFRAAAKCPVEPAARQWIDERWDWLTRQFGRNRLRAGAVVLPIAEFFPDPYEGTEECVRRMLDRVCGYMDVDPGIVELSLFRDRNPVRTEKGHNGAVGYYHPDGDQFRVWIEAGQLGDPLAVVATMAHELGHVHLLGHGRISEEADDHEPLTDLLTVFLGLGVITSNSVIREKYWDVGHSSGWQMGRHGYLGMSEYGYALARFALDRDEDGSAWSGALRLDVRRAFIDSLRFLTDDAMASF